MAIATAKLLGGGTVRYHDKIIGQGTSKDVYFCEDGKSVVCFYRNREAGKDPQRRKRLETILSGYNLTAAQPTGRAPDPVTAEYYRKYFCWPTAIVEQPLFGFIAPRYPDDFFFKTGPVKGKEKNGDWFILPKPRKFLQDRAPVELGDWRYSLLICAAMARGVSRMHLAGLAHSDLSPNNVLVDPTTGRCVIIDIDSLVVPKLHAPDVLGTPGYIAPEVLQSVQLPLDHPNRKHPSITTDLHAMAILVYQYLMLRHPLLDGRWRPTGASGEEQDAKKLGMDAIYCEHPKDHRNSLGAGDYVPSMACGKRLASLFERAFVGGIRNPMGRPSANEWLSALVKTLSQITFCGSDRCRHRWFVVELEAQEPIRCPFCRTAIGYPFPLLKLTNHGQSHPDGHLVTYQGMNLMQWHAFDEFPGPTSNVKPLAQVQFSPQKQRWILKNVDLPAMKTQSGQLVPRGADVPLDPGTRIVLADGPKGRIVEVTYKNGTPAKP